MRNINLVWSAQWYEILFIVLGSILLLGACIFGIIYVVSLNRRKKIKQQANEYYVNIIQAVGGIDNIVDVSVHSSRLSFILKDVSLLKENLLNGVGIIKSNKKVTLVIGDYAKQYFNSIQSKLQSK